MREGFIQAGLWIAASLARLPRPFRRRLELGLGWVLFYVVTRRRQVALRNLALCLPSLSPEVRRDIARAHFACYARAFFDRFALGQCDAKTLAGWVEVVDAWRLEELKGQPVIVLAPHFLGLDAGGVRLQLLTQIVSMYSSQPSQCLNDWVLSVRSRFNEPILVPRNDGIARLARLVRRGLPAYFLPDMDFGERDAVFATFFGQPAATVTSVVRLAQLTGAAVLPLVTTMTETGYRAVFYPPWTHDRDDDLLSAVQRMNDFIEARVLEAPSQYLWTHRRFKTRPAEAPSVYG
ncbi:MAG: Lipid biosynthesis lauroyl acyltransferase [Pseudomonadota bacterium]